jgi:CheY-like chemotaxis protein
MTMKLLIVDDHAAMRCLIRRITSDLAECIEECADGAEALVSYEQHRFGAADWVLMDVEMAGMDGLTATRALCAAHPEARIVIVTKHNNEAMRAAAFNSGACGFVPKDNLLELRALISAAQPYRER